MKQLELVTSGKEVAECQKQFSKLLKEQLQNLELGGTVKDMSGPWDRKIYYNDEIWWYHRFGLLSGHKEYYQNEFGLSWKKGSVDNHAVVHITIPASGIDPKVSGIFATDHAIDALKGNIFVLHRGGLTGSRGTGQGKYAFLMWYIDKIEGEWVEIEEPLKNGKGEIKKVILIGSLNDPSFLKNLTTFIRNVAKFKYS